MMEWLDVKDAPIMQEVLISISWSLVPVVAWMSEDGFWYSSKDHLEGHPRDEFGRSQVEAWLPLPKPKWKLDQESGHLES